MSKQANRRHTWAWCLWSVGDTTGFTGDDLDSHALDDLYAVLSDNGTQSMMAVWWRDKPHQILNRLLCRLTRADQDLADMERVLWLRFIRECDRERLPGDEPTVLWVHAGWQHDGTVLGGWSGAGFQLETYTNGSVVAWPEGTRLRWVWPHAGGGA